MGTYHEDDPDTNNHHDHPDNEEIEDIFAQ